MASLRVRPSNVQIAGVLISIFVGIGGGIALLGVSPNAAVVAGFGLSLLGVILTFVIDIYYGPLAEDPKFQDALKAYPILKHYLEVVDYYMQAKREFDLSGEMGQILSGWLDDRVTQHYREAELDWKNGRLRFQEDELARRSVEMQKSVLSGGFAAQLERSTSFWETAQEYLDDTRKLARQGRKITRVFILSSSASLQNEALARQIAEDDSAQITTLVAYANELEKDCVHDFGVYDDRLVSIVSMTPIDGRVTDCTYSVRREDVELANSWKIAITRRAHPAPHLPLS